MGWPGPDQRAKGELYVRGLMLDGKRKPMAAIPAMATAPRPCSPRWALEISVPRERDASFEPKIVAKGSGG